MQYGYNLLWLISYVYTKWQIMISIKCFLVKCSTNHLITFPSSFKCLLNILLIVHEELLILIFQWINFIDLLFVIFANQYTSIKIKINVVIDLSTDQCLFIFVIFIRRLTIHHSITFPGKIFQIFYRRFDSQCSINEKISNWNSSIQNSNNRCSTFWVSRSKKFIKEKIIVVLIYWQKIIRFEIFFERSFWKMKVQTFLQYLFGELFWSCIFLLQIESHFQFFCFESSFSINVFQTNNTIEGWTNIRRLTSIEWKMERLSKS